MEKFRRQPDEEILLKGSIDYLRGEQTLKAIMFKGAVKECKASLTSKRFVAWERNSWGMFVPLLAYLLPKEMVFEIPLDSLASIRVGEEEEKVRQELFLKRSDGAEFRIRFDSLFDVRDKWVDTLLDAVKKAQPGVEIQKNEAGIDFVQRAADA